MHKSFSDYINYLVAPGTCTCKSCQKVAKHIIAVERKVCMFDIHLYKQAGLLLLVIKFTMLSLLTIVIVQSKK